MIDMVLSALFAPLMLGIRKPVLGGLLEIATGDVAVALSSVVGATDDEPPTAVAAAQSEHNELVHPSRMVENWTTTSGTATVRTYRRGPSTARTSRAQAGTWALTLFHPRSELPEVFAARHFSNKPSEPQSPARWSSSPQPSPASGPRGALGRDSRRSYRPEIGRINSEQLAEAQRGPSGTNVGLDDRLVLERCDVPALGRIRGGGILLARSADLRSPVSLPTANVVASGGLDPRRRADFSA